MHHNTRQVHFRFNDLDAKRYILLKQVREVNAAHRVYTAVNGGMLSPINAIAIDPNLAVKRMHKKHDRYYGNTSKYKPHQGARERARRLRNKHAWPLRMQ